MATNSDSRRSTPPELSGYRCGLEEWPRSWMGDQRDLLPGQEIVECFKPFLVHLAGSGLSKKTVQKHIDHLWLLGGEIIRDLQQTPRLRKTPVNDLLLTTIEVDGPLLYHCDSEEQQRSFDSTCRKLRRFLSEQVYP